MSPSPNVVSLHDEVVAHGQKAKVIRLGAKEVLVTFHDFPGINAWIPYSDLRRASE